MKKVLFPGSFDPITYGHMDVIDQALKVFDKVIVCVMVNSSKKNYTFSLEERVELIKELYKDEPKVEVIYTDKKISATNMAIKNGATSIIKGLRNVTDFAYEFEQAKLNFEISDSKINTIAFFASPSKTVIASSTIKELYSLNIDITPYAPKLVIDALSKKIRRETDED